MTTEQESLIRKLEAENARLKKENVFLEAMLDRSNSRLLEKNSYINSLIKGLY